MSTVIACADNVINFLNLCRMSNSTSINYSPEDDAIGIVQNPLFLETDPVNLPAANRKESEVRS